MPQGHDITIHGESFDFYLYDPHATSPDDLLTPSDDSLFHVRSRISGQVLPFIGLSNFTQDAYYMEDVKDAIKRVIEHDGKDQDVISLLPNREIVGDRQILNFSHLLDYAGLKRPASWTSLSNEEMRLREAPIGDFLNRGHYASTLFTPISRLHASNADTPLPFDDYQAVMETITDIADKADADSRLAIRAHEFVRNWRNRVIDIDGHTEFLKTAASNYLPHVSKRMRAPFFKDLNEVVNVALGQHRDNDDLFRLGERANRVACLSDAEHVLQRITRYFSVDPVDDNAPDQPHPAKVAAARLIAEDTPYVSADDLLASGLFRTTHVHSITATDDRRTTLNTEAMRHLSAAATPEGMRNIFQIAERCDWTPNLFTSWGNEASSLLGGISESLFWRDIEAGKPLREILRDTMDRQEQLTRKDEAPRPLSKRSANLYLHNAMAMDRINTAIRHYDSCESETLYTDSGERIVISFDGLESRQHDANDPTASYISTLGFPKEGRVTYLDAKGEVIFDHQGRVNRNGTANDNRKLQFNKLFKHPLHVLQLPPGKVESYLDLNAVVGCQANNKTLSGMMGRGYLAHLDQQRDEQGRKVARKDYQSWIDAAIKASGSADDLTKYLNNDYLMDSDTIAEDIARSLFLNMAKASGLEVGSRHTLQDLADDDNIDKDEAFTLDREEIDIPFATLRIVKGQEASINYKKDMVERADHLHHVGASLVKDHLPQADLQWEPATGIIPLDTTDDGTRYEARPLASYHEIQRHGQTMSHCAGTYASQCMAGRYYLWAIIAIDPDGNEKEFSTLGMQRDGDDLEFDQHFGYNNASVPQPVSGMVDLLAESLNHASVGFDPYEDPDWGDDGEDDYDADEAPSRSAHYDVTFEATSYGGGDDLSDEEIAEVIANYHWQSEEFGQDAMRLLSRVYGEEAVKQAIIDNINENLGNNEDNWPEELTEKMTAFREYVTEYDLHRQEALSLS